MARREFNAERVFQVSFWVFSKKPALELPADQAASQPDGRRPPPGPAVATVTRRGRKLSRALPARPGRAFPSLPARRRQDGDARVAAGGVRVSEGGGGNWGQGRAEGRAGARPGSSTKSGPRP